MSALHLIRDGMSIAAQLAALLFITPIGVATAAEIRAPTPAVQAANASQPTVAASPNLRPLHLVDGAFDVRLLGPLAGMRVLQSLRNDSAQTIDLGTQLPPIASDVDTVSVHRDGRSIELLAGSSCGGDDDPNAGHAHAELDEIIADLMQLPPGQRATIEITATERLQPAGRAWRVELPATVVPVRAQALVVRQPESNYVVIVPPYDALGSATLTLRSTDSPSQQWTLGPTHPGLAYVIPVGDDQALRGLLAGAAELELRSAYAVHWTTLPIFPRDGRQPTLARSTP